MVDPEDYLRVIKGGGIESPEVDIVAIHGLDPFGTSKHAEQTWTADGKLWLRDFLPNKLPTARVLLFAYNANVAFNPENLEVRDHAMKLLQYLHQKRKNASHRPIVFVCHSLGGLVVKRALVIAQTTKVYGDLKNATYGIQFFGTPHRGGNLVALGKLVAWVIRKFTLQKASNNLLTALEKDGFFTKELSEDFRQQLEDYHFVNYFESRNTKIQTKDFGKVVEKESATFGLSIDREKTLALSGDHSSICKFASEDAANYEMVEDGLVDMVENAIAARKEAEKLLALRPVGTKIEDLSLHDLHNAVSKWLVSPDEKVTYNRAWRLRVRPSDRTTGAWFLCSDKYRDWSSEPNTTANSPPDQHVPQNDGAWLWLHGIPGCGKTVLNASIVESLLERYSEMPECAVAYYYFDFNDQNILAYDVLTSLMRQLFDKKNSSPALSYLYWTTCRRGIRKANQKELLETFHQMLQEFGSTYLVLDALDECKDRTELLKLLSSLAKWMSPTASQDLPRPIRCRVLCTSRREHDIFTTMKAITVKENIIQIKDDDVNTDIQIFLNEELHRGPIGGIFRDWEDEESEISVIERIERVLLTQANGMFLMAKLQLQALADCVNLDDLDHALDNPPRNLDETYERILTAIPDPFQLPCRRVLRWIILAKENLYVEQVEHILAVKGDEDLESSTLHFSRRSRLQNGQESLFKICSSLIAINLDPKTERKRVTLAHSSVRDFFLKNPADLTKSLNKIGWLKGMVQSASHEAIAKVSLAYLSQFDGSEALVVRPIPPLARYAAQYWAEHSSDAGYNLGSLEDRIKLLFTSQSAVFENWIRLFDPDQPEEEPEPTKHSLNISPPWYYACLLGLDKAVEKLRPSIHDIDSECGFAGNALHAAASRGHDKTVQLLLNLGANVNFRSYKKGFPSHDALQVASYSGSEDVVRLLLKHRAEVNPSKPAGHWGFALQAASYGGHKAIVQMLLEAGANVNAFGGTWDTAMIAASWQRHVEVVKLLIDRGADANIQGFRCGTALQAAAYEGQLEIVRMLVEDAHAAVNTIAGGREGHGTALTAASAAGKRKVVEFLLEKGAEIDLEAGKYRTALIAASVMGELETARLLLSHGANVHTQVSNGEYECALSAARQSNMASVGMVQLLQRWI